MNGAPTFRVEPVTLRNGTERVPTQRQVKVVTTLAEHGGNGGTLNKGEILREVGYSEVTAATPSKVFGSPTVIALMDEMGLSDKDLAEGHRYLLNAQRGEHMVFPPYMEPGEDEEDEDDEDTEVESNGLTKKEGERMTDAQVKDFVQSFGGIVHRIVHGDQARHVYYRVRDARALKDALDMGYQIKGTYAPKKIDKRIGVFSLKDLREKMQEKGIDIITHEHD